MGYGIPSDRLPKPALPSETEARIAVEAFVKVHHAGRFAPDQDSETTIDIIYYELIEPLLGSLEEWRDRAVERRKYLSYLADRMRVIRDAVLDHQGDPSSPDSKAIQYRTEDGI